MHEDADCLGMKFTGCEPRDRPQLRCIRVVLPQLYFFPSSYTLRGLECMESGKDGWMMDSSLQDNDYLLRSPSASNYQCLET